MNKIKTNTVVEWVVVNKLGYFVENVTNRKIARATKNLLNMTNPNFAPYRIAKTVVTK